MQKILLVEDDNSIIRNLSYTLECEGFSVTACMTKKDALNEINNNNFDLILLDLSLPDGNGYAICSMIRRNSDIPVIFLTASDDEANIVTGFDIGADDYITKPFRPLELISRIKNALRRHSKTSSIITIGNLKVDSDKGIVYKNNKDVFLSALEYRLLLVFLNHQGQILTRNQLLENIWDAAGDFVNDNTLTVYIKRLREKIEDDPQNPTIIKTIRGLGYKAGD